MAFYHIFLIILFVYVCFDTMRPKIICDNSFLVFFVLIFFFFSSFFFFFFFCCCFFCLFFLLLLLLFFSFFFFFWFLLFFFCLFFLFFVFFVSFWVFCGPYVISSHSIRCSVYAWCQKRYFQISNTLLYVQLHFSYCYFSDI